MEKPSLDTAKAGAIRFNTDSSQLEIYDGNQWTGILATSPELQTGGTRGMQFGGNAPSYTNNFFNISTTGNGASFGSFASNRYFCDATASRTRAVVDSGEGNMTNREFFTIASGGGGTSFGSCYNHRSGFAFGSETRGVFGGGNDFSTYGLNTIEYVTISSEGSGIDYGDLSRTATLLPGFSSATRGVVLGDYSNNVATTQFMTISTGGTTSDYGDSTSRRRSSAAASNAVRGIEGGGITMPGSSRVNTLDFYTIATLNNAADFGDLTSARELLGGASSSTRAVFFGGETPSKVNTMDYVQFASEGDAIDFGDLTGSYYTSGGTSNGHGGL
jgi:hypothetical protein